MNDLVNQFGDNKSGNNQASDKQNNAKILAQRFVALPSAQRENFIEQIATKGWDFKRLPLVHFPDDEIVPLTQAQRRLWFTWKMAPDSHAYNLPGALRWRGRLERSALECAVLHLIHRHTALCTRFIATANGGAEQRIAIPNEAPLQYDDVADIGAARLLAERYTQCAFDLESDLPFRCGLIRITDDDYAVWIVVHHIVADGWSMQLLLNDLLEIYGDCVSGRQVAAAHEYLNYRDYACWQRYALTSIELERQLAYWRTLHAGDIESLSLPTDRSRPAVQSLRGARHAFRLSDEITAKVREHASASGVTLFMWLLTAYQILLYRLSGQSDLRIGIASAGRHRPETENVVGFFVGTQVLRLPIDGSCRFDELLQAVRAAADGAQAHPDLPFDQLVEALAPIRDLSRNPIFQAKFTQQIALPAHIYLADAEIELIALPDTSTHFDLGLDITDYGETIEALFTYDTDLFDAETVLGWGNLLCEIAHLFSIQPASYVADWQMSASEFPHGEILTPEWPTIPDAWRMQLASQPNAPAVQYEDQKWTRREIDIAATQLAQALVTRGVIAGDRIALCTSRSDALVIGILAAWKCGAAYVPLDAKLPAARLRWILEDAQAVLVIVDDEGQVVLSDTHCALLHFKVDEKNNFEPAIKKLLAQLPAYLIYTSGSTGQPKGVVVTHAALAHYTAGLLHRLAAKPDASFAMVSTVAADLGHTMLFGALADGRLLHLISAERAFDPDQFAEYMSIQRVGVLKIVPSHLQGLLQAAKPADVLPQHALILGGETTHPALLKQLRELAPTCRIINHYGPTETTVGVLTEEAHAETEQLALGRPLPQAETWILDADLNTVPAGVAGELYLGGPQVAQGYAGKPALTAERFVPHPFTCGERLYRSGDAVKRLREGRIIFLGRRDDQIKIRGYRVELREIVAQLLTQPDVSAAEVLVREHDGHAQLFAWVTPAHIDPIVLKAMLASKLPDYMVPNQILPLTSMPLNNNGKIDRAALPLPNRGATVNNSAPRNEAERVLLAIWQSVLNSEAIGIDDNFFELGGDSILSLQVIARARKSGLRLTPKQLFEHQTIAGLAAVVAQIESIAVPVAAQEAASAAAFALTPIQHYFFSLPIPNRNHWNQSVLLAPRERLNLPRLQNALARLVDVHPALRTCFIRAPKTNETLHKTSATWRQQIGDCLPQFSVRDVADNDELLAACEAVQRSLDIQRGQMLAALLAELPDGSQRLLLCVHHLAIDGVSWRILLEDVSAVYRQPEQPIAPSSTNCMAWSQRLQQLASDPALSGEREYWRSTAKVSTQIADSSPTAIDSISNAKHYNFALPATLTRKLQTSARTLHNARGDELLIAALVQALAQFTYPDFTSHDDSHCIWLEHHGRDLDDIDASRCIGWFTNLYPVLLPASSSVSNTLIQVQQALRTVPRFGAGFGLLRYLADDTSLQAAAPTIVFNHLGRFDNSFGTDALFDIAAESAGVERDPEGPLAAPLTVVSHEIDDALYFDWTYSTRHYSTDEIAQLAQQFVVALTELTATVALTESHDVQEQLPVESYPTAPIQQGLLFHAQIEPTSTAYINQLSVTFADLDIERFKAAWRRAITRHAILRTAFEGAGAELQQRVYHNIELPLRVLDWRAQVDPIDQAGQQQHLEQLAFSEKKYQFKFDVLPLMRLVLVRLNERDTRFIWTRHHILLDGWSTARLLAEIVEDYSGRAVAIPHLSFRDHIDWLARRDTHAEQNFWLQQLHEWEEPTLLASGFVKPTQGEGHALHIVTIDSQQTRKLIDFARTQHVTLNTLIQSAWAVLLGRYCGQRSVCLGVTVAGRSAELDGIDEVLGLFINTLPLICDLNPAQSVAEFLRAVQARNAKLREFEHMPLSEIQRLAGGVLFDSLLVFENFPLTKKADAVEFSDVVVEESTHYALTLVVEPGHELTLRFSHDLNHIDAIAVQQLSAHLCALLTTICAAANAPLGTIALPQSSEHWNATQRDWGLPIPVHEAIRRQALHSPQRTALVLGACTMTYAELDVAANAWAQQLLNSGVGNESIVAISAERSFELVIGLLAILKAGATYLPIDPDYPADRIAYMLADARPALMLTQHHLFMRFSGIPVAILDETVPATTAVVIKSVHPQQLAYLIYTSGSTGKPKGTGNTHGALCNRLAWMQAAYPLDSSNRVLQKTPISFDVSVWEFFWPLMTGATLVLAAPNAHRDPQVLIDTICEQQIDTLHFVPSMLQALLMHPDVEHCTSLRQIICSGEALPVLVQNELLTRLPQARLYNLYGPTEAAIDVTHWTCTNGDASVPIGAPIANTQIYILDSDLNPLPAGVAGELYIGGVNLARGYLGRFGLTAERFVSNPFSCGERLYRSGDLARWRSDGNIEYLGRLDHQIKLRGQRIELGEIETALRSCIDVRDAVVIAHLTTQGHQLAGYVILNDRPVANKKSMLADIRAALQKILPDYMVPATLTWIDTLPLSPNGKLDRKALPAPEIENEPWQQPQGELESRIATHWQFLLGCELVGRRDQFFALGGHSLIAAQLVARLRGDLGVAVPLKQLFDTPVLADFAAAIHSLQAGALNAEKVGAIHDLLNELEI